MADAEDMFKTTLMGGYDKEEVDAAVKKLQDDAYSDKNRLETDIKSKDQELSDVREELEKTKKELAEKDAQMAEIQKTLDEKDQEILRMERDIREKYQS